MLHHHRLSDVALGIYRRDEKRLDVINPTTEPRARLKPLAWRGDDLLLISDHEGSREEIWVYDDTCGTMSQLFENPRMTADCLFDAERNRLLLHLEDSDGSELALVDAQSGTIIRSERVDGCEFLWSSMSSAMGDGEWFVSARTSAIHTVGNVASLSDDAESLTRTSFEPEIVQALDSTCDMHDVSYTTFDLDKDGKPREIEGVLFLPKRMPSSPSKQAAIIYAHGGPTAQTTKSWSPDIQFLCGLGYIVFGPNPRGSYGKGKTFEQLNDQDWGGVNFRDYCQGLLYLLRRFGISARRVGMLGGSYGGYMTNWALTRPNTPFAYGISLYGISDLLLTVRKSAIASMTLAEMGDPDSDADIRRKYIERSPITWSEHLASPMLLIHGSRDNRTVTDQSRLFHERLRLLDKDVTYLEVAGEGHGFKTVRARVESMQAMADFLWRVAPVLSEEELEREDMLEELHAELLDVVQAALDAAADPTDEKQREIQSRFDQTRQRIWERAKELRVSDEPFNLPGSAD
jgi:dipeptidyl aminopeptidase/acylaminoacyl peptidase